MKMANALTDLKIVGNVQSVRWIYLFSVDRNLKCVCLTSLLGSEFTQQREMTQHTSLPFIYTPLSWSAEFVGFGFYTPGITTYFLSDVRSDGITVSEYDYGVSIIPTRKPFTNFPQGLEQLD